MQENVDGEPGKHECELLRAYDCNDPTKPGAWRGKIWQACRATSAAPVYFEHIEVGRKCYFDGGLTSNNPIREAYDEARTEFPNRQFEAIVSIGTGKRPYQAPPRTAWAFFKQAMHQITDTEDKHVAFLKHANELDLEDGVAGEKLSNRYFRLNDDKGLFEVDLAAYRKLDLVEQFANAFVASAPGAKMIQDCAGRLAFRKPVLS